MRVGGGDCVDIVLYYQSIVNFFWTGFRHHFGVGDFAMETEVWHEIR